MKDAPLTATYTLASGVRAESLVMLATSASCASPKWRRSERMRVAKPVRCGGRRALGKGWVSEKIMG